MARVLKRFEYFEPRTVGETIRLLSSYRAKAKVLAGGTDLLIEMKRKQIAPQYVVYIGAIQNLDYVQYDKKNGLRIGALATHATIAESPIIKDKFGLLATACNKVGNPHIRAMGTIGGNLCQAGPSQDTPPVLLVLDAKVKLVSLNGERLVPIDKFYLVPFKTALNDDELLTEIQIPRIK